MRRSPSSTALPSIRQHLLRNRPRIFAAVVEATQVANKGAYGVAEMQLELFRAASTQLLMMFADATLAPKDRAELARWR